MRTLFAILLAGLFALPALAGESSTTLQTTEPQDTRPRVTLKTDLGVIELELDAQKAPATVENFLAYVDSGFYNGIIFHRVIPGFMAQGGGYTFDFQKKDTRAPVTNESANGLSNQRGTISMARVSNPDSATSQFFINLADNSRLDGSEKKAGYTVFGKVVKGMEVVDKIVDEPRGIYRAHPDAPNAPVRVLEAKRKSASPVAANDRETDQ